MEKGKTLTGIAGTICSAIISCFSGCGASYSQPVDNERNYIRYAKGNEQNLALRKEGDLKFIIDPFTGEKLSLGYSEIMSRNNRLFGELGDLEYELDSNCNVIYIKPK